MRHVCLCDNSFLICAGPLLIDLNDEIFQGVLIVNKDLKII